MKKFKKKQIFRKQSNEPIKWFMLKNINFEDDDILDVGYDEGFYSENESWEPHYYATVTRMVEETEDEYIKRLEDEEMRRNNAREMRREQYERLKKEFEGDTL